MEDKPKMLNIKNFIKQESGRLPSFVSRDLSLGGSKIKKVYTPNVNAVRNKAKPTVVAEKTPKQQARPRVQRRQNNDGRFVQSSSVFSEGTANIKRPTLYSNKHASIREQETSAGIVKPKVARTWKIDVKEEASVVDDLLGCDDDSDEEADSEYQPIVLPLSANRDGFLNHFRVKKEVELKIKREENDGDEPRYRSVTPSFVCGKMYDDEHPTLSLLKLPDSLPGKGFDENDKTSDYTLSHLLEGQIGKMLVRKSGRVDFIIGSTAYNVDTVEAAEFDEEVVAVPGGDEDRHVVNVGPIDQKYVISPDWNALLDFK